MFTYEYQKKRFLYGKLILSRVRLALTNDNLAAHVAFDGSTQMVKHLGGTKHMLCVFHAVVTEYQEIVYDLLPQKRKSKDLSDNGALYDEI